MKSQPTYRLSKSSIKKMMRQRRIGFHPIERICSQCRYPFTTWIATLDTELCPDCREQQRRRRYD